MSYLSISTWSLHRILGPLRWTVWDEQTGTHRVEQQEQPQLITLLELPEQAAKRGYQAIEICHFHFPSTNADYLMELRSACKNAGISLDTLLLDYGDLTTEDENRRKADLTFMKSWIDTAAAAGAKRIRIIAGEAPAGDLAAIERSAASLSELAEYATAKGVRVVSENFRPLTSTADSCIELLSQTKGSIGFITDFGNFSGDRKYEELAAILPSSSSVHAKAHYDENGLPDAAELRLCLELLPQQGYNGAIVLIYDGPGDMWEGLERVKIIAQAYL